MAHPYLPVAAVAQEDGRAEAPPDIPPDVLAKVATALRSSVMARVKHLGPTTIDSYITMAKTMWPTKEGWEEVEQQMRGAVDGLPKLRIICSRATVNKYEKRHQVVLVVFLQQGGETKLYEEVANAKQVDEEHVVLELDALMPVANFSHGFLRFELRKKSPTGTLLGFKELPLREIPMEISLLDMELERIEDKAINRQSMLSLASMLETSKTEAQDSLLVSLSREGPMKEVDCNTVVPALLHQHWKQMAEKLLKVELPSGEEDAIDYCIKVDQKAANGSTYYQKLIRADDEDRTRRGAISSLGSEQEHGSTATFPLECLVTDKLEVGINKLKTAQDLSPLRQMTRSESKSPLPYRIPKLSDGTAKIYNKAAAVGQALEAAAEAVGTLSPWKAEAEKEEVQVLNQEMKQLLRSLASRKPKVLELPAITEVQWEARLTSVGSGLLGVQQLQLVMTRGLNINTAYTDLRCLFSILRGVTDGDREEMEEMEAAAYMTAHKLRALTREEVQAHMATLAHCGNMEALADHTNVCLRRVEQHRAGMGIECNGIWLQDAIQDLAIIVNNSKNAEQGILLKEQVNSCLKKSALTLFEVWKSDVKKDLKDDTCRVMPNASNTNIVKKAVIAIATAADGYEVCRNILNKHIYTEVNVSYKDYQEMFSGLTNYRVVLGDALLTSAREHTPKVASATGIWGKLTENIKPERLQMAYDCFFAMRRVWECLHPGEPVPGWLYHTFIAFPDQWNNMAIGKADEEVSRLLQHLKDNKNEFLTHEDAVDSNTGFMRTDSVQDITNTTLISFQMVADRCWNWRKELGWPDTGVNLKLGLTMVKKFAVFEKKILKLFDDIDAEDNNYDAYELSRTIKLINGLRKRQETTAIQMQKLHEIVVNDDSQDQNQEYFKEQFRGIFEEIAQVKECQEKEIKKKMNSYCEGRRKEMRKYIKEKKLVTESEECLMGYVDEEMKMVHRCMKVDMDGCEKTDSSRKEKTVEVISMLWSSMEKELEDWFTGKKKKNEKTNKPERFMNLAVDLDTIIDVKKTMYKDEVIKELDLDILNKSK